ncbi:MAG: DNA-processing protein DprA [Candidatus Nanosyncoccaceae bacterium]|jgi:DNA processing protein
MFSISKITPDRNSFLRPLSDIYNSPKEIYFYGKLPEKRQPSVAIVGSRRPTTYGREMVHKFAYALAQQEIVIISGLALGIDALAHKACLEAGGTTLAVLGGGLNDITPRSNQPLGREILRNGGAILSEYEPSAPILPHQFLERNRIVSGLADAVIVIEAAKRSGTLSTAAHALQQGRDIFAVPGHLTSPMSEGCNNLIKQGATLLNDVQQVLDLFNLSGMSEKSAADIKDPIGRQIIEMIRQGEKSGENIMKELEVSPAEFNYHLTILELQGAIKSLGSNQWALS